jgi:peptidoglycan/xylan/chitin deacetylase (PgdA/CDA1 family)
MYFVKTPGFFKYLFPNGEWEMKTGEKNIFLTFDDGPIPEITPWVLDTLNAYDAKATFFCVGENAQRHPDLVDRIREEGHSLGSHTFNHLNGWHTENTEYYRNVRRGAREVGSELFRPPYGKLKFHQARFLSQHYRIIMWDILGGDFDPLITSEQVYQNLTKNVVSGSIIVLHDSIKSMDKVRYVLPRFLDFCAENDFHCVPIQSEHKVERVYPAPVLNVTI